MPRQPMPPVYFLLPLFLLYMMLARISNDVDDSGPDGYGVDGSIAKNCDALIETDGERKKCTPFVVHVAVRAAFVVAVGLGRKG